MPVPVSTFTSLTGGDVWAFQVPLTASQNAPWLGSLSADRLGRVLVRLRPARGVGALCQGARVDPVPSAKCNPEPGREGYMNC